MFIMPRLVCDYVHRIVLQFYVCFCIVLPSCGQLLFLYPASYPSCAILSQTGLLEVIASYLGSFGYFLAQGHVLSNGYASEKLMLMGESRVRNLLSLVSYPKCVHFASLTLPAKY
jgi:hypothetical protein